MKGSHVGEAEALVRNFKVFNGRKSSEFYSEQCWNKVRPVAKVHYFTQPESPLLAMLFVVYAKQDYCNISQLHNSGSGFSETTYTSTFPAAFLSM